MTRATFAGPDDKREQASRAPAAYPAA
jgi:hypothetical protein